MSGAAARTGYLSKNRAYNIRKRGQRDVIKNYDAPEQEPRKTIQECIEGIADKETEGITDG